MFKKVLIAEDHESANISVQKTLQELGISEVDYVHYCDDAFGKIQKALRNAQPYQLLITDLSFDEDGYRQKLGGGADLIAAARQIQPELKILVFSAEYKEAVIRDLFQKLGVNGYVRKGRRDAQELRAAIETIYKNKQHLPLALRPVVRQKNAHDFTSYDIVIITQLAKGMFLKDIPMYMQQQKMKSSSMSSIEKRLNQIKEVLGFSKNEQLVAFCKDVGII